MSIDLSEPVFSAEKYRHKNSYHHSLWIARYIALCTLLCSLLLGVCSVNLAGAAVVTGDIGGKNSAAINPNQQGSMIVNKSYHNPYDPPPAGFSAWRDHTGLTFRIERLEGFDLTQPTTWDALEELDPVQAQGLPKTATFIVQTNSAGKAYLDRLPIGVYLIRDITETDTSVSYWPSAPTLVTLPLGDTNSSRWQYDLELTLKDLPNGIPLVPVHTSVRKKIMPWVVLLIPVIAVLVPNLFPLPPAVGSSLVPHHEGKLSEKQDKDTSPDLHVKALITEKTRQSSGGFLPATGVNNWWLIVLALLAMLIGICVLALRRVRSRDEGNR